MSVRRAGTAVTVLLAAPHLINPDWLRDAGRRDAPHGGPAAPWPGQPRDAAPGDRVVWPQRQVEPGRSAAADEDEGRDALPFAAAAPVAPAVAGRLAAAARAAGERTVFGCPVASGRSAEPAVAIAADGAQIHAAARALAAPDLLIVLPSLSAALLTTTAGFAVAAGPRPFAEAVAGADARRARTGFAEFALAARGTSALALEAAAYYGCALSGRPWRPAWLAWSRAAEVPPGSGVSGQLAAMHGLADGRIGAADFGRMFRAARLQEIRAGERTIGPLAAVLDRVCWALDGYVPPDEGWPRAPGELGLAGLREAVGVALTQA